MKIIASEQVKKGINDEYGLFINEYIDKLDKHSLVYLYALREAVKGEVSDEDIGKALNMSKVEVDISIKYLSAIGVISISENRATIQGTSKPTLNWSKEKPEYTLDEITYIKNSNKEVSSLFEFSEEILGRGLSYNDIKNIYSFYDYYRLPVEVIKILMEYCVSLSHTGLRYIERAVIDWAENGINTVEKARLRIESFKPDNIKIQKAMGISGRGLTFAEKDFINKWKDKMGFDIDAILLACDKTISTIGKASFNYADAIINDWDKQNVKTLEEILALNKSDNLSKPIKQQSNTYTKSNTYNDYKQRRYDSEAIDKLAFKKLMKLTEDK